MGPSTDRGRPTLLEQVGTGGSAVVWRAWHDGRVVAAKRPRPGVPAALDRLRHEATVATRVAHEALLRGALVDGPHGPWLRLPWMAGGSLAQRLAASGPLGAVEAMRMTARVATALGALHDHDLVHRDVKPGNVLLDAEGVAHLGDLGCVAPSGHTSPRDPEGSPAYLAPEVLAGGGATPRADLFALGVTVFEALTGALPPTNGRAVQELRALRPDTPDGLIEVVTSCLAADPSCRPGSAAEVAARLGSLADEVERWAEDPDAALAAWSDDDPRTTRLYGPAPVLTAEPTAPAPVGRLAVAMTAVGLVVAPVLATVAIG